MSSCMANTPLRFGGLRPKASAGHPPLNRSAVIELRNQCVACSRQLRINRHMWPKLAILPAGSVLFGTCAVFLKKCPCRRLMSPIRMRWALHEIGCAMNNKNLWRNDQQFIQHGRAKARRLIQIR